MKRREILRRVLAAGLCLCVCAGLAELALPALASAGGEARYTEFYVEHIYLGSGVYLRQQGRIYPYPDSNNDYHAEVSEGAEPGRSTYNFDTKAYEANDYGAYIYPTDQTYTDETTGAKVTEHYTGYEIADGNDNAVMWVKETGEGDEYDPGHFHITYNENVQNVVLYLFYSYDGRTVVGANFGEELKDLDVADQDILEVTGDNIEIIKKAAKSEDDPLNGVEPGDVIYNTAAGLHTEKRVSEDVMEDGRTFDVGLESWYTAASDMADVGFILDSSGSMVFVPDPTSAADGLEPITVRIGDKPFANLENADYDPYMVLPWNRLYDWEYPDDPEYNFLKTGNTDNSPLAYTGYSYYVYDSRDTVGEMVPLAYWDGTMVGSPNPLQTGLVGLYQFDREKYDGSESKYFKNGAPDGGEAGPEVANTTAYTHNKTNSDYKRDYNNYSSGENDKVTPYAGSYQMYTVHSDGVCQYKLPLDAVVTDPKNFTLSFAVKTTDDYINQSVGGPRAQDLVTIRQGGDVVYTIVRGIKDRSTNNNKGYVRWYDKSETSSVELPNVLDSGWKDGAYKDNAWRVFTYVVENGEVTAYVDGKSAGVTGTLDLGSGPLSFTLGGEHVFSTGPTLQIDEVHIYDGRALDGDEVAELVETMQNPTGSVTKRLDETTALVGDTQMNLHDYENFNDLTKEQRAGWYYVNSIGTYNDINAAGSAKSLHGLSPGGKNTYPANMGGGTELTVNTRSDEIHPIPIGETIEAGETIKHTSPCLFYFALDTKDTTTTEKYKWYDFASKYDSHYYSLGILHCVFSPASGVVLDSPVFVKTNNNGTYTKAQKLQIALNTFINRLRVNSPDSQISAVRFSSETYGAHPDELLMQTWTSDPNVSTGMMSLSRGSAEPGMANANNSADGLYNYVTTGGTCAYTGLQAFIKNLANADAVKDDKAKYVVLFTDGQDDELKDDKDKDYEYSGNPEDTKAYKLAEELRNDYGYTIFTVRLISGDAGSSGEGGAKAKAFLQAIADDGNSGKYFEAKNADELEEVFSDIIDELPFKLTGYTVRDYIDPRFDLVADTTVPTAGDAGVKTREIVHLHADGEIHIGQSGETSEHDNLVTNSAGHAFYFSTAEGDAESGYTERYTRAWLKYDIDKKLYYLEWDKQGIPLCRQGSHSLSVWSAVVTLRAKEDFIGGSALLTNGPDEKENMVFLPGGTEDSGTGSATAVNPSKGFPRTQVNVKPYRMVTDPTVDVRYLGESIEPRAALEDLFTSAEGEIRDLDHLDVSLAEWQNRDGSGYYYEYVRRYINQHPTEYANLDAFLDELVKGTPITLNYSFLPAVVGVGDHDHATQTGGTKYESDVLGTITYQWSAVTAGLSNDADTEITDTDSKQYKLTVTFTPTTDHNESGLISDTAYTDLKPAVGDAAAALTTDAVHTTYVVGGQLAVKAEAPTGTLQELVNGKTLNVTVTEDGTGTTDVAFKLSQTELNSAPEINGAKTVYLTADKVLPMGSYTMELNAAAGDFTDLDAAGDADYQWRAFGLESDADVTEYMATGAGAGVTFQFGAAEGADLATVRADLAETLAAWVDDKVNSLPVDDRHDQTTLNALALDPTLDGGVDLPDYLKARLGMGSVGITITPPAKVTLTTKKTLTNSSLNDTHVSFELTLTADGSTVPASTVTAVFAPRTSADTQTATFETLTFDRPGTYTYTLAEKKQDDLAGDGFTFDETTHTVVITVTDGSTVTVTVDGTAVTGTFTGPYAHSFDLSSLAAFTNTYTLQNAKPVEATFGATKELTGEALTDGQFTFRLTGDGANLTAKNDATGKIAFDPIEYTKAGTYTYSLYEEAGAGNYEYDINTYTVVVTVNEQPSSDSAYATELFVASVTVDSVDKTASQDNLATFNNETITTPGVGYITGTKIFANGEGTTATFVLEAGEYTAEPGTMAVAVDEPEAAPDTGILPDGSPVPEDTPVPEDAAIPEATAIPEETAVPEETAAPEATAAPEETPAAEATPVPEETAIPEATEVPVPEVQPELPEGPGFDGEAESFDLEQTASVRQASEGAPVDESVPQDGEGMPDVPVESEPFETQPPVMDPSVTDLSGDAGLDSPEWDGMPEGDGEPEATEAPAPAEPAEDGDGEIMTIIDTGDDSPLPGGASGSVTTTTTGSGSFRFGPITFEAAGTYTYTVYEDIPSPATAGTYYDTTRYTVTFVVTGDPAGTMNVGAPTVTIESTSAESSLLFLNTTISKTSTTAGDTVEVGDTLKYNVSWANFSKTPGTSVVVSDLFDPGVDFKSARFTGPFPYDFGHPADNLYTWTFTNQNPGDTGAIEITTQVNEDAALDWGYDTSSSTLAEGKSGETDPTVYNRASVACMVNRVLTPVLTEIVQNPVTIPEKTGSLTISKTVTGEDTSGDFTFTVHVDGADGPYTTTSAGTTGSVTFDASGDATVQLHHNESVTISGLPADASYTVTETGATGYTTTSYNDTGTIPADSAAVAAFVNTKLPPAGTGDLTVSKIVTGDGDRTRDFHFTVTVNDASGAPYTGGDIVGGTYSFALQHNGSRTFELPANATYTVTETDANADGYNTTVTGNATGTITEGGMVNVTFTNNKPSSGGGGGEPGPGPSGPKTGSLAISKTVTGAEGETDRDFHFTVTVPDAAGDHYGDVSFDGSGIATLTIRHGRTVTIAGLPAGASYTVTEAEADTEGYATTAVGAAGRIPAGGTATAAFTNEKPAPSGPVTPTDTPTDTPAPDATPGPGGPGPVTPTDTPVPTDGPVTPTDTPAPTDGPSMTTASPAPPAPPVVTSEPFGTPGPDATPGPGVTSEPFFSPEPGATSEPVSTPVPGNSSDGGPESPPTGDDAKVLPWLALLLLSGACLAALVRHKRLF